MNPQYMMPGQPPMQQNNNAPNNPLGFPPSPADYNGHPNANMYGQNGSSAPMLPPKSYEQGDVSQKLQNMNLNQGFSGIPTSQLPPGQMPPGAGFSPNPNLASNQRPQSGFNTPGRPPVGSSPGQFPPSLTANLPQSAMPPNLAPQPIGQGQQKPPMSQSMVSQAPPTGGLPPQPVSSGQGPLGQQNQPPPQFAQMQPLPSLSPSEFNQSSNLPPRSQSPPQSRPLMPPSQGPPSMASSQIPQNQGHPQSMGPQPGGPGKSPGPNPTQAPQQSRQMPQPGQMPQQPGQLPPGHMQQPGQMPPQPGQMPPQPGQMPPQPGQQPQQPGQVPPHLGQMPQQPGQMLGQPGQLPPQPGQMQQQSGQFPNQPGQMPLHSGQIQQQPSQMQAQPMMQRQAGPPQPGQMPMGQRPGPPPQQYGGQPMPNQGYQQPPPPGPNMPGLPHMPPPLSQQQQQYPGMPPINQQPTQQGFQQPGLPNPPGPPGAQYQGMPPAAQKPNQPPSGYPPQGYPGQQQPYPGQQQPQPYPGQQPQYPGQTPPFPSQQPSYQGQPGFPAYAQPQQPLGKRLDPDQMPSPIQVMADDQQNRGGIFVTNERGLVPPLVSTDFQVDDQGNASPRFIRSSMYSVPVTADLLKQTSVPLCLVISPLAETVGGEREPPLLDFAALTNSPAMGPVRCSRCKAYMCPGMKFLDAARHFKCPFCKATTEVPMEYTQYVNNMQQYGRMPAEMALGTYEIVATKEYCRNNTLPNPPAIVFMIDVSYNAVRCGLVHAICDNILKILEELPRDEQGQTYTRVGFITYSSTIHFYNIKGTLGQPQMLSVGDVADVFVPLLEGFLVRVEDSGSVIESLLQQIPTIFADNKETEIILLPAVQAGLEALKAAETVGQLLVFHTSLPSFPAPGKLANRDDRKLLATDKEKQILNPQTTAYNELGQACSAAGVCVELFLANNAYVDAATIGQLSRLTGGQVHKYTYFQADVDGARLVSDVCRVVSRPTAHDAVMRVRTSTGVRATDFYGHFFMSNTTDVELAAIDADKAIAVELKHDDKLTAEEGVYIQAALLYTHRSGQRRLRVLNLALNVGHQLADVYRSCELDTIVNFLSKQAIWALRDNPPRQIREGLSVRCARSLATYRRHCATPSSAGQLVLPESMKLLPLYTSCLLRSDAIAGGPDITCDDRSLAMYRALTADVATSLVSNYPRLLPLHRLPELLAAGAPPVTLPPLRASIDKMCDQGVYLLENGVHMLLWVGIAASPAFVSDVFGVPSAAQIDAQVTELPVLDNELSEAARDCVADARARRKRCMRLTIMRQHDKLETVLRHFLVEDRGVDGSASYVDFLCHVHKEIRALL